MAWSRISSKVIAHPPEADAACSRRCGNGTGRSSAFIPHSVAKGKQEVLGECDAMLIDTKGHGPRTPGQTATAQDPQSMQEYTMIRSKRDAKKHAKARQRRYLKAQ